MCELWARLVRISSGRIFVLSLFWIVFSLTTVWGQDVESFSYSAPKRYTIKDIEVAGVQFLEKDVLVQLSGLRVGDTIELPSNDITKAVKKLRKENLFSSVEISVAKIEGDNVVLRIELKEQPRTSDIRFEGIKKSQREDINDKLSFKIGQQATASNIDAALRVIRKYFYEKGYWNVQASARQELDTTSLNTVIVTFAINRGKKVRIKEISFEGNHAFDDAKLRKKGFKDTKRRLWWNPFRGAKYVGKIPRRFGQPHFVLQRTWLPRCTRCIRFGLSSPEQPRRHSSKD